MLNELKELYCQIKVSIFFHWLTWTIVIYSLWQKDKKDDINFPISFIFWFFWKLHQWYLYIWLQLGSIYWWSCQMFAKIINHAQWTCRLVSLFLLYKHILLSVIITFYGVLSSLALRKLTKLHFWAIGRWGWCQCCCLLIWRRCTSCLSQEANCS